jgi:hypothetical protein
MKKLQSLIFGKKANVPSDKVRTEYGDVGIVFAPGPDKGLYIKGIVKGSPAWEKNCSYLESQGQRDANDGSDGAIRIGDCLLDIQEVDKADKKARGKKYDVFAKPEDKVLSILKKMQSPFVEFSFRRIAPSGDSALITVLLERKERTGNNEIQANQAIAEIRQRQVRERMTEIDMRFAEIDEDGSGSVTLEELLLFLQVTSIPLFVLRIVHGASFSAGHDFAPISLPAPRTCALTLFRCPLSEQPDGGPDAQPVGDRPLPLHEG